MNQRSFFDSAEYEDSKIDAEVNGTDARPVATSDGEPAATDLDVEADRIWHRALRKIHHMAEPYTHEELTRTFDLHIDGALAKLGGMGTPLANHHYGHLKRTFDELMKPYREEAA